jgi:hypothetical protein
MARPLRIEMAGGVYHVTTRGWERRGPKYDSFGRLTSGPSLLTRYHFTGREWDSDAQLWGVWGQVLTLNFRSVL